MGEEKGLDAHMGELESVSYSWVLEPRAFSFCMFEERYKECRNHDSGQTQALFGKRLESVVRVCLLIPFRKLDISSGG